MAAQTLDWLRMSAMECLAFISASSRLTSSWSMQSMILATIVDGGTWGFPVMHNFVQLLHYMVQTEQITENGRNDRTIDITKIYCSMTGVVISFIQYGKVMTLPYYKCYDT